MNTRRLDLFVKSSLSQPRDTLVIQPEKLGEKDVDGLKTYGYFCSTHGFIPQLMHCQICADLTALSARNDGVK